MHAVPMAQRNRWLKALQAQLESFSRLLSLLQGRIRSALVSSVAPIAEQAPITRHELSELMAKFVLNQQDSRTLNSKPEHTIINQSAGETAECFESACAQPTTVREGISDYYQQ